MAAGGVVEFRDPSGSIADLSGAAEQTRPTDNSYLRPLIALSLGSFAIGTTEFLPAALLPTIASDLNVGLDRAGFLITGYAMGVTLMTPVLAAMFSRWPRKLLLISLMAAFVVTHIVAACSPGYYFLLGMRFLTAFSHGVYFAVASTVAAGLAPPGKEGRAISILFAGLTIAMATVVPSGSLLGQWMGWRTAFAATGFLGLVAVVSIWRFVPALNMPVKVQGIGHQLSALREPRLMLVLGMTAVGYAGTFVTYTYLAATLNEISGFSKETVALMFSLLGIGVTIGNLLGGRVADLGAHRGVLILYSILSVCLLFLWSSMTYQPAVIVAVLLLGVTMFSPGAGLQLLAVKCARKYLPGAEGAASALNQSAFNLGIASGAFLGGFVVTSPLGMAATPLVSICLVVIAIAMTCLSWRWELQDSQESAEVLSTSPAQSLPAA